MGESRTFFLSKTDTICVFGYSLLFLGVMVPRIAPACLFALLPFLGGAWIGGLTAVSVLHVQRAYVFGAWFAVFLQAYLALSAIRAGAFRRSSIQAAYGKVASESAPSVGSVLPPNTAEHRAFVRCAKCDCEMHESARSCLKCGAKPTLPAGVKGWSWGAILLNWVWALFNGPVWLGLLSLVPYLGFIMAIVLGFKGREWAWRARHWESVDHFQRVQRKWSRWALGLFGSVIVLGILGAAAIPAYQQYERDAASHATSQ